MRAYLPWLSLLFVFASAPAGAAEPVPAPPCPPETPTEIRSTPVLITGMFFDVIGAAALVGGTTTVLASHACGDEIQCSVPGTFIDIGGIAVATGGAIFLAIGIPLTVVGAQSVPVEQPMATRTRGLALAF